MKEVFLLAIALMALLIMDDASAGRYSAPGLYEVKQTVLDNGLRVITKQRDVSRNVSILLNVNVGFDHFVCAKRETPHFLEHLLFTGTRSHDEYALARWVEDAGGDANAYTTRRHTAYTVTIYRDNLRTALAYLHEIMTQSVLSENDVNKTRDIINRERGGDASRLRMALYESGVGKSGMKKAYEQVGVGCPNLVNANTVTRDDVQYAFNANYHPANMELVVVGDFDEAVLHAAINETLGQMTQGPAATEPVLVLQQQRRAGTHYFESTLSPVVGTEESVGVSFFGPGERDLDIYALRLMEAYLDQRVFKAVRIEGAYSYAPSVYLLELEDISLLDLSADVEVGMSERVLGVLENEVGQFLDGNVNRDEFESIKQGLLYDYAVGYETNDDIAMHYVSKLWEIREYGRFIDGADLMEKASLDDVRKVAARYFPGEGKLVYVDKPTMTYTQLFIVLAVSLGMVAALLLFVFRRRLVRR